MTRARSRKWGLGLLALAGIYVLLAGQVSLGEALAAIAAVGGGFLLAILQRLHAKRAAPLSADCVTQLAGVPAALVRDTVLVGGALVRSLYKPAAGRFEAAAFGETKADQVAVAVLAESLAPNGYVIDYDDDKMVLHRLVA